MKRFQFLFTAATADAGTDTGAAAPGSGTTATAAAATTAPAHFGQDGSLGENWHTALGDEFAPHASQLSTFKDVGGLAKSYLHLRAHGPAYPGEGATPDDISRFHALAKVPVEGTPTGYGIQLPTDISDADKSIFDRITATAHKHHVSGPGLNAVVAEYQKILGEQQASYEADQQAATKAATDGLIAKWGTNFEANKSIARHTFARFAEQAGIAPDSPEFARLANDPAAIQMMFSVAGSFSEDGTKTPAGFGDTRTAQQKIEAILSGKDPVWGEKYTKGSDEDKRAAYQEVVRLQVIANK